MRKKGSLWHDIIGKVVIYLAILALVLVGIYLLAKYGSGALRFIIQKLRFWG